MVDSLGLIVTDCKVRWILTGAGPSPNIDRQILPESNLKVPTVIRGLYSAAGGMSATSQQQDAIAHNLAHAVKPGYLREIMRFEAAAPGNEMLGPSTSLHTDFTPGTIQFTGNKLDLALEGPGMFAVQGPTGTTYTRNGVFQMNQSGQVVTMDGLPVLGQSGPIEIPPGTASIEVLGNGAVIADGIELDQFKVVTFENPTELQRIGTSYFQAPPNATTLPVAAMVFQGHRELSNSTLVQEMVQMISGVRHFEAAQRALRSIGDAIAFNTRPVNR
jgi:flagellar basal body rod protein FlgG